MRLLPAVILLLLAFSAAPALAAPPANDNRANATEVTPPDTVTGTLNGATREPSVPLPPCDSTEADVFYRFTPPASGSLVVTLDANGELDGSVTVYRQERSELTPVDCDRTDKKGQSTLVLDDLDPKGTYLIQVSRRAGSASSTFKLGVLVPSPPATAPGKALPDKGVKDSVDRLLNPSDIYNRRLQAGVPYRVSLSRPADAPCVSLTVAGRGETVVSRGCGGYAFFTPERSGRYLFTVESDRKRGTVPYFLRSAVARRDDTTPGVFIRNYARIRGRLNGRLDSVDLYRFDVTRRSRLSLRVGGAPDATLLGEGGGVIDSGSDIERVLPAGRYFAAVRGAGRYKLRRISRVVTRARTRVDGRAKLTSAPGRAVDLAVLVDPAAVVAGRAVMTVQRFDPLEGWQFLRRYRVRVARGRAAVAFVPPSVGRYRVFSSYLGSRTASPADTGTAFLRVVAPLQD